MIHLKKTTISLLCTVLLLTGCATSNTNSQNDIVQTEINSYAKTISVEYSDFDLDESSDNATAINLSEINGDLEITNAGSYILEGTLQNGQVVINVAESDKVHLILNNATISCDYGSPIQVDEADKVSITLMANTINTINDTDSYNEDDERKGAAIYSASSLTINGQGKLVVNADYHNGIGSKKNIKIISGDIEIDAANNGIKGNNSVAMKDGNLTITALNDGIKTEEEEDTTKGYVYIENGNIDITSTGDGIDGTQYVAIHGGNINVTTIGLVEASGSDDTTDFGNFGGMPHWNQGNMPSFPTDGEAPAMPDGTTFPNGNRQDRPNGNKGQMNRPNSEGQMVPPNMPTQPETNEQPIVPQTPTTDSTTETTEEIDLSDASAKGIKAGTDMYIGGGSITINATDHTLKSDGSISIVNGNLELNSSLCKGITADGTLTIAGGNVNILNAYEGIESKESDIIINGGNITVNTTDDGINAAGDGVSEIRISGGNLVVNADGDGIDSNNSLNITGGNIMIEGPTNNSNSALDHDGDMSVTGGNLIAYGPAGMLELPNTCTQYTVSLSLSNMVNLGSSIKIVDSKNNTVVEFTASKVFQNIVFSNEQLTKGNYTVYIDGNEHTTFEISDMLTTVGNNGFGGFGNMENRGDRNNFGNRENDQQ
ncbi:MAG: carbohydrate-binding domain-containing protein [Erysipelotrichales bacterium]|nr:carbohydrate-binding domain-containing protein [Erysipelotrichales bacterium]